MTKNYLAELSVAHFKIITEIGTFKSHTVSNNSITLREFAKLIGTGPTHLVRWLKENRYLISSRQPDQAFLDCGYFQVIEKTIVSFITNQPITYFQVLVTGKGQSYFSGKFNA